MCGMTNAPEIRPILCHLAWLAENVDKPANRGRAYDAALLTYNAAAMLQWRFVFPMTDLDTPANPESRNEAASLIDALVTTARKTVTTAKDNAAEDERFRRRLSRAIRKVVERLSGLMLVGNPVPEWLPELQSAPDIAGLMDEFLKAHRVAHGPAIAKGKASADTERTGPNAAIHEAIAWLVYAYSPEYTASGRPKERNVVAQMAAGYLKTAVELQSGSDLPATKRRRLQDLSQCLVEQSAEGGDA